MPKHLLEKLEKYLEERGIRGKKADYGLFGVENLDGILLEERYANVAKRWNEAVQVLNSDGSNPANRERIIGLKNEYMGLLSIMKSRMSEEDIAEIRVKYKMNDSFD